jgi:antitoxin PrlF
MTAIFSRLTSESQTTVPDAVREALDLQPGDALIYVIEDGQVRLKKLERDDVDDLRVLQSTLGEWDSLEDAAAFDDL